MLDAQVLDLPVEGAEPATAVGRQPAQPAVLDRVDVGGFAYGGDDGSPATPGGDRAADGLGFGERLHRAVDAEPIWKAATVMGYEPKNMRLVFPRHRRWTEVFGILEVAVAGDRDVEMPVGGETPRLLTVGDVELDVPPTRQIRTAGARKCDLFRGRPRQVENTTVKGGDLLWIAVFGRDRPQGTALLEAGGFAQVRDEGDVLSVGRPGSASNVVGGCGKASRLAAFFVNYPDAGELVPDSDAISAPCVVADPPRGGVVCAAHDEAFLAGRGEQEEAASVG